MKKTLKLYRVTLDWQQGDPEQGDYCALVWAADDDAAIRKVAGMMADSGEIYSGENDSFTLTRRERKEFIEARIAEAGPYGAELVADGLADTLQTLLGGPRERLTAKAERDLDQLMAILRQYGVTPVSTGIP